tara:strand:- start:301 stop:1326 length:1026 start_codon:yes stop_codon:yes gene_type:complete
MMQSKNIENSVILITGGTGSFGGTLTELLLKSNVKEIRIFSRDENKQYLMRKKLNDSRVSFFIGDVRDFQSTYDACLNVDYIFHAAALKQVPSCEFYPLEAFKTNVLGTENILKASVDRDVKKVVFLSSDKAVYPINAMGIAKAMMEKLMLSKSLHNYGKGVFCATRYGNVICSRGSVIPLFVDQIKQNKPITITDPNMTRYLMSLEDAVSLVLYALDEGLNGDIFVQKAPACTIGDLVLALKEIFNYKKENIIIGTRHSEKLYETLVSREEMARVEDRGKFFKIPPDNRGLDYDNYYIKGKEILSGTLDYTSHNTKRLKVDEIIEILLKNDVKSYNFSKF